MVLKSSQILKCFCLAFVLIWCLSTHGQQPGLPQNIRGYLFPAEVLLQWDAAEGAAYYRIDAAGLDRRWRPIAAHVTGTSFRDTGLFELAPLYLISAVSASGEVATAPEILVQGTPAPMRFFGLSVQMVDETSASFRWELDTQSDAQVEIRTGTQVIHACGFPAPRFLMPTK